MRYFQLVEEITSVVCRADVMKIHSPASDEYDSEGFNIASRLVDVRIWSWPCAEDALRHVNEVVTSVFMKSFGPALANIGKSELSALSRLVYDECLKMQTHQS